MVHGEFSKEGHNKFAQKIQDFLKSDELGPKADLSSSVWFQEQMVDALVVAVRQGKELRLARLLGEREPLGIFICPSKKNWEVPIRPQVFTRWSKGKSQYHLPKFVSLLVQPDGTLNAGHSRVLTREWINGLWFATRRNFSGRVVFPWPF